MNNECTLLLSTYDGGEDLWEGFFKAMTVQWPEMDMNIAMNTETKDYTFHQYNITTYHPEKKNATWAERIISCISHIKTEYVLLFLEDFWLTRRVDDAFFRKTLAWMRENPDVANFSFYPCLPGENIDDGRFERFELRPQKCQYKYNCQVGLWRTKELMSYFRPHESPWEWEIYGSIRAGRNKKKFYSLKDDVPYVFHYGNNLKGCVIHKGKWVKDEVLPLAELYGLKIDYSLRGFEDFSERRPTIVERLKKGDYIGQIKHFLNKQYRKWLSVK